MKNVKWAILVSVMALFAACSDTPVNHSKPEMSVQEKDTQPPRTFNQYHKDWDY